MKSRIILAALAAFLICSVNGGAAVPKKSAHQKSSQRKPVSRRKPVSKGKPSARTGKSVTAAKSRTSRTAKRPPKRTWRAGQTQPTSNRYKEIQEALAKKGYLHGEPTGAWDQNSVDALRRFQQEQNLDPTGKLDSLSIIALGLGPKYEAADKPAGPH